MSEPLKLVNRGLAVGIPFSGKPIIPDWAVGIALQGWPINTPINWMITKGIPIDEARTKIVGKSVAGKMAYLLFVDEDVVIPHYTVNKLLFELQQHQLSDPAFKIIGGIYCTKSDPPMPVMTKKLATGPSWDWTVGDVFECEHVGTGCMLIDMSMFNDLPKPWFETVDKVYEEPLAFLPEDREQEITLKDQGNEDSYFTRKAMAAGFKILAHGGIICPHWDAKNNHPYTLPDNSYPVTSAKAKAS
jgi:hypothetical protein